MESAGAKPGTAEDRLVWVYTGSHNFSQAAWGAPISPKQLSNIGTRKAAAGQQPVDASLKAVSWWGTAGALHIMNWEIGVVLHATADREPNVRWPYQCKTLSLYENDEEPACKKVLRGIRREYWKRRGERSRRAARAAPAGVVSFDEAAATAVADSPAAEPAKADEDEAEKSAVATWVKELEDDAVVTICREDLGINNDRMRMHEKRDRLLKHILDLQKSSVDGVKGFGFTANDSKIDLNAVDDEDEAQRSGPNWAARIWHYIDEARRNGTV